MCYYQQDNRMKCDLPGLYVQPRGGVKGLKDGECTLLSTLKELCYGIVRYLGQFKITFKSKVIQK